MNEQVVCFHRCSCYRCYSVIFHQSFSLWTCMQCTESLMGRNLPLSHQENKSYFFFFASVVQDLSWVPCLTLHCALCPCTTQKCGPCQPELPSESDFCMRFGMLCFCSGHLFVKAEIRPPVLLTNLTLMSGWLPASVIGALGFYSPDPQPPA